MWCWCRNTTSLCVYVVLYRISYGKTFFTYGFLLFRILLSLVSNFIGCSVFKRLNHCVIAVCECFNIYYPVLIVFALNGDVNVRENRFIQTRTPHWIALLILKQTGFYLNSNATLQPFRKCILHKFQSSIVRK